MNSNVSRPMPRANTGSPFLNFLSNMTMFLLQMERRIDPWLRPIFDAYARYAISLELDGWSVADRRAENEKRLCARQFSGSFVPVWHPTEGWVV